jgi:hypothetical protein
MTTLTVTSASVGMIVAQAGTLSQIRFLVGGREQYAKFILADVGAPYDTVAKQIYCSDMLSALTNGNGALAFPAGVILTGSVTFGSLAVLNCPDTAVFEIDCDGALSPPIPIPTSFAGTVHAERLKAEAQRRADDMIVAAERARTKGPATTSMDLIRAAGVRVAPPPEPEPPDAFRVAAMRDAYEAAAAETAARTKAAGPVVIGPCLAARETEALIYAARMKAERRAAAEHVAEFEARAAERRRREAEAQAEATALLKGL